MYPRTLAKRCALRIAFALTILSSLLLPTTTLWLGSSAAQNPGHNAGRAGRPRPGKPEGEFPNLDSVQIDSHTEREAPPPVPSNVRSEKNAGKPWDERRVGNPHPLSGLDQAANKTEYGSAESTVTRQTHRQTRRAHVRRFLNSPPVPDDQFVLNFFTWALLRNPTNDETTYWYDHLRVAYGQNQVSRKLATIEFGRTLFESAEYAARNRDAHWYVYDLYKAYLMRDPDSGGWAMWEGLVPTHGRGYVRRGFEESTEFATYGNSIYFAPDAYSASLSGINLITHELTHVKQYRLHGLIGFGAQYGKEFIENKNKV
jgi:Domain of unknown function (DUF4214)/Domain of unknown function (DUF4157)